MILEYLFIKESFDRQETNFSVENFKVMPDFLSSFFKGEKFLFFHQENSKNITKLEGGHKYKGALTNQCF